MGLILEVVVALSRVTVSRKRSVSKRKTPADQEMIGEKCGSDEDTESDTFYRKTVTNTSKHLGPQLNICEEIFFRGKNF